VTVIVTIGDI